MKYANPKLRQMLAAEYALGSLRGRARRRFERLLARDPALRAELAFWEERLGQLGLRLAPIEPREVVWIGLQKRMEARAVRALASKQPSVSSMRLWQTWSAFATAASLVLGFALWTQMNKPPIELPPKIVRVEVPVMKPAPPTYVAMLQPEKMPPKWALSIVPQEGRMLLKTLGDSPADAQHDCQLWVIAGGKPISAGVLPRSGEVTMAWPSAAPFSEDVQVAVSMEPAGGSTTGAPTGPVIAAAPILRAL